ncbi:MAG TPA: TolC family protein, partial [Verrucomicrobiae bacterium]|nr:TolC family protein [Verrucomicrobiae bacterium]
ALDYNNQLLRENKKRVEVGALAPLDEKQAEAEVARGVATLLQTEQSYAVALNTLKNLITQDFQNWANVVLDPVETLVAVPASWELTESWKQGLTMRPEIQEAKLDLEARDINIKYLKNQMWPLLDLTGSYGENALNTSYSRVIRDLPRDNNPRYSAGVVLSIPLGNRRARNDYKAAKATRMQALLDYKAIEQEIMVQIDNAIKLLQSQFQQVEATRQARLFAQDALAAEQKKYENGKSTSFLVLQFQRDLTSRRFEELAALADYNKAVSGLSQSVGGTLTRFNLNVSAQ